MTGCRNYLYSLSVNPDPSQGQLTRAQYLDYIDRAEAKLNLSGQPRAIVFHIKEGREHCHVVWSRIDAEHGKAVHQAFDHQKLMLVTRDPSDELQGFQELVVEGLRNGDARALLSSAVRGPRPTISTVSPGAHSLIASVSRLSSRRSCTNAAIPRTAGIHSSITR